MSAPRLHFGEDSAAIPAQAFIDAGHVDGASCPTYVPQVGEEWDSDAPLALLPTVAATGLPPGALTRTVWARVVELGAGENQMRVWFEAVGRVAFYRDGVRVGFLPYDTGKTDIGGRVGDGKCRGFLWQEINIDYESATDGTVLPANSWPSTLPVDNVLTVGFNNTDAQMNGLPGLKTSIDCDEVRLEIDTLRFFTAIVQITYFTFYVAVLSQPSP